MNSAASTVLAAMKPGYRYTCSVLSETIGAPALRPLLDLVASGKVVILGSLRDGRRVFMAN